MRAGVSTREAVSDTGERLEDRALEAQQQLLAVEPSAVPGQAAVRTDDPVARQHDRHRVPVHHRADRPRRARVAGPRRERTVRRRLAVPDARELRENANAEVRLSTQVEADVEIAAAPLEILVQLAMHALDRLRRAQDARSVGAREQLELAL